MPDTIAYDTDLAPVRRLVESHTRRTTLGADRSADLILAASEVAANTLGHARSGGTLQVWHDKYEILCQAQDPGWITDPLAGRVRRGPDGRGHGLYLVNHVCDLVEVRTGPAGTTIRMHMRRFTRLTNGFSKKVENHMYAVALHYMFYNFAKIHKTLRVTPAMQAGLSDHIWSLEEIAKLAD